MASHLLPVAAVGMCSSCAAALDSTGDRRRTTLRIFFCGFPITTAVKYSSLEERAEVPQIPSQSETGHLPSAGVGCTAGGAPSPHLHGDPEEQQQQEADAFPAGRSLSLRWEHWFGVNGKQTDGPVCSPQGQLRPGGGTDPPMRGGRRLGRVRDHPSLLPPP